MKKKNTHGHEDFEESLEVPPFVRRKSLGGQDNVAAALCLEFRIGLVQEHQELLNHVPYVARIHQGKAQFHCSTSNRNVGVL